VTNASGQRRARYKALSGGGTLRLFRVTRPNLPCEESKTICGSDVPWRWRAASTEAFALYVIVARFGRAPKAFPKRAYKFLHAVALCASREPTCRANSLRVQIT
jgi:hypothetical protein